MAANGVVKIIANAGALWIAARYIPGFQIVPIEFFQFGFLPFAVTPLIQTLLVGGLALAVVNLLLHPILRVIGAALPFVTGAMLMVALNIVLLYLGAAYVTALTIGGGRPLFWSGLLLGIVNTLL